MKELFNYISITFLFLFMTTSCEGLFNNDEVKEEIIEKEVFSDASILDVSFIDKNIGFIAGSYAYNFPLKTAVVGKTIDGGDTWDVIPVMFDEERTTIIRSIYALNKDTVFATFTSNLEGGMSDNGICISYDGGETWHKLHSFQVGSYRSLIFLNRDTGFVIRAGSNIYKTNNRGTEWEEVFEGGAERILFLSDKIGYTYSYSVNDNGSSGSIIKTIDGGNTWERLSVIGYKAITCLVFSDELTGYAFAFENEVYKTVDGGESWVFLKDLTEYGVSLYYSAVITGSSIYFGTGHSIFRTDNDFRTIKRIYTSDENNIYFSIKALQIDPNRIIFLSSNQSIIIISTN